MAAAGTITKAFKCYSIKTVTLAVDSLIDVAFRTWQLVILDSCLQLNI